jgi:hypothetical protein
MLEDANKVVIKSVMGDLISLYIDIYMYIILIYEKSLPARSHLSRL